MQKINIRDHVIVVHEANAESTQEQIEARLGEFEQYEILSAKTTVLETSKTIYKLNFVTTLVVRGIKFGDDTSKPINIEALLDKNYRSTLSSEERIEGLRLFLDYYKLTGDLAELARMIISEGHQIRTFVDSQKLDLLKKEMKKKPKFVKEIGSSQTNNN